MTIPMSLFFALGILVQTCFFIGNRVDVKKLRLGLMITGIVALWPSIIFFYILIFPLFFSIIFRKETLQEVKATTIISCTILFWFVFLNGFYQALYPKNIVAASLLLTSIYVFYILFFVKEPNNKQIQTLLGWFLFSLVSLTAIEFWIQKPAVFIFNESSNYLDNFNFGMIFMYVTVYGWHVVYSSFYEQRKSTSPKDNLINHKISRIYAVALIIFQTAILIINYRYRFISEYWMMTIWLIFLPQIQAAYSRHKLNSVELLK
jgi:uncharacterized membrane protein YidH (DUF202 family)